MMKKFKFNEKGAGGIAEVLIIILAAVLITGAVVLLLYNAISDKGNTVTQGIRGSGTTSPSDLDGDGLLNGLVLVGIATDGTSTTPATKYWRPANPIKDYGQPGITSANLDTDDDGVLPANSGETVVLVASNTQDNYFAKQGATLKSTTNDPHDPTR